jgi:dihydroxyacid dehydratase/phosphogluconate dehydratase
MGGPLACIRDGDMVEINVPERRIQLLIPEEELHLRTASSPERPSHPATGMLATYRTMVSGADSGAVWL